jgi:CheY-like chemotaxis protein
VRGLRSWEDESGNVKHRLVIALTASVMQEDRDAANAAGMDDYLTKPLIESELKAMLEKWL